MKLTFENALEYWDEIKEQLPSDTREVMEKLFFGDAWNHYGKDDTATELIEDALYEVNENLILNKIEIGKSKKKTKVSKLKNLKSKAKARLDKAKQRRANNVNPEQEGVIIDTVNYDLDGRAIPQNANRIKDGKKQVAIKFEDKVVDIPKFTYKNAIKLWGDFRIKRYIMNIMHDRMMETVDFQNQLESMMARSWDKYGKNKIVTEAIDKKLKTINEVLGYKKSTKKAKAPKVAKVTKPSYKKAPYWYKILQKFKNMAGKEHKTTSSIQDFLIFLQNSCNAKLGKTTPFIELIRKIQDVIYPYANNIDETYQDLPKWESLANECKEAMATITISKKTGVNPNFETVTLSGCKCSKKRRK